MFQSGNEALPESADVGHAFSIYIDYYQPEQWDDSGIWAKPTAFDIEDLEGIINVALTLQSASSTEIVVDVKTKCGSVGVSGLVTADFLLTLDSDGSTVAVTATESTTVAGRYTLAGTFTLAAHTLKTKDQPDATTKGYETPTAIAVTPS